MKIYLSPPQAIHEMGKRTNQEDALYPPKGKLTAADRIFILCDGMGGHEKGEVASQTISQLVHRYLTEHADTNSVVGDATINEAIEYAWQQLDALDDGAAKKMGTTLTFLVFHKGGCTAGHIGDSRIYHLRPQERSLCYKSKDHSLVYELFQAGEITYEEMKTSPQKNIITRAVMPGKDRRAKASLVHITDIRPGDYFYLCSDGMLEEMEDDELLGLFCNEGSDEKKVQQLINATAGNSDNHTALIIRIERVEAEPGDEQLHGDEATAPSNALNLRPIAFNRPAAAANDVELVEAPATPRQPVEAPAMQEPATPSTPAPSTRQPSSLKKWLIALLTLVLCAAAVFAGYKFFFEKNFLQKGQAQVVDDQTGEAADGSQETEDSVYKPRPKSNTSSSGIVRQKPQTQLASPSSPNSPGNPQPSQASQPQRQPQPQQQPQPQVKPEPKPEVQQQVAPPTTNNSNEDSNS